MNTQLLHKAIREKVSFPDYTSIDVIPGNRKLSSKTSYVMSQLSKQINRS